MTDLGFGRSPSLVTRASTNGVATWVSGASAPFLLDVADALPCADFVPPVAVIDLQADLVGPNYISLVWSAPADAGGSGSAEYDLRWYSQSITKEIGRRRGQ